MARIVEGGRGNVKEQIPNPKIQIPKVKSTIIEWMLGLIVLIGLGVGVALNILADGLPPDEVGERGALRWPHCRVCGERHAPQYALAVVAALFKRGRCEHCGAARPLRHGVVEVVTALSCAAVWVWAGGEAARFLPAAALTAIFILITVIDIEHRLILWSVILPASALALLFGIFDPARGWMKTVLGGLAGYGLTWLVFMLAQGYMWFVGQMRGEPLTEVAFGGGDVNLAGLIGLAVGWTGVVVALVIAVFSGGLFSLSYLMVQSLRRRYNPHTPIPYGPFLVFGALVVYFFGAHLKTWGAGH
jgi:prepilin signal peptidase PulO-like enzyme (type II secretory pathway)